MQLGNLILLSTSALVGAQNATPAKAPSGAPSGLPLGPPHGLNAMNQTNKYMGPPAPSPSGTIKLALPKVKRAISSTSVVDALDVPTDTPITINTLEPIPVLQADGAPSLNVNTVSRAAISAAKSSNGTNTSSQNRPPPPPLQVPGMRTNGTMTSPPPAMSSGTMPGPPTVSGGAGLPPMPNHNGTMMHPPINNQNGTIMPPANHNGTMPRPDPPVQSGSSTADIYENTNMILSEKQVSSELNGTALTMSKKSTKSSSTSNARALSALGSGLGLFCFIAMLL